MGASYFKWIVILITLFLVVGCDQKTPKKSGSTIIDINPSTSSTNTTTPLILPMDTKGSTNTSTGTGATEEDPTGIKLDPNASKYAQEGLSYFKQGKETEAFESWSKGIDENGKDTNALFCLAQYYWDNGDEEESLDLYRRFYEGNPSANLKKQVGRTFKRPSVDSYEDLMSILKNRSSRTELLNMISDTKQKIREFEAEAINADRRDEPDQAAFFRGQAEQLKSKLRELENQ